MRLFAEGDGQPLDQRQGLVGARARDRGEQGHRIVARRRAGRGSSAPAAFSGVQCRRERRGRQINARGVAGLDRLGGLRGEREYRADSTHARVVGRMESPTRGLPSKCGARRQHPRSRGMTASRDAGPAWGVRSPGRLAVHACNTNFGAAAAIVASRGSSGVTRSCGCQSRRPAAACRTRIHLLPATHRHSHEDALGASHTIDEG
jgi:hypothetical protein